MSNCTSSSSDEDDGRLESAPKSSVEVDPRSVNFEFKKIGQFLRYHNFPSDVISSLYFCQ